MGTAEIGQGAIILAFLAAIVSVVVAGIGAYTSSRRLISITRISVISIAAFYSLALATAVFAFLTRDYSLRIVSAHVDSNLPASYALSALYADKAGSMLLWGWLISLFSALIAFRKHEYDNSILPHMLCILAAIQVFFLAMVTFVGNVFEQNPTPVTEGIGLNPWLQNIAMLVHPPVLYISFAAVSVVFAMIIASLITRTPDDQWVRWVRRWTLFGWCTLGIGNLIGMWWSYNELGWGGYWAWDPVENAGLMPWFLITAFIHSISVQRQRNRLRRWSLVLAIFTFEFTLLIPFITHGGIESPLHGFIHSYFPPYILAAILITLAGSLGLLYIRRKDLQRDERSFSLVSREGAFLATNIILVLLTVVVLIGTVLPRIVELFSGTRIAIDRSFYDRVAGPIMLVLVFFMGVCPLLGWAKTSWKSAKSSFLFSLLAALLVAVVVLIVGGGKWYVISAIVCCFPFFVILLEWFRGARARHQGRKENYFRASLALLDSNRPKYGGFLVHIGIILIALGIVVSSFYSVEKVSTLDIGQSMKVGDYDLTYDELLLKQDNVKISTIATISMSKQGRLIGEVYPENNYWFYYSPILNETFREVAVRTTPAEDVFVYLWWTSFDQQDKSATIIAMVNPLVVWIWAGGGFLLLGGAIAFSHQDKRESQHKDRR
ncbi:MAG TPA: heme lyase CcmF/NrfE family subunit [Dehalococcoidia bacterium]|nr:heme lyase CcmF/NrfE family subunit [Dehalococcoidia bacterium]